MSGTSATTRDTEIARNPHQPEGWRRNGIDFFVAPPPRCTRHRVVVASRTRRRCARHKRHDDPLSTPADQEFIRRAYEIARRAYAHGNRPFGALLVDDGKTIAEYENRVNTSGDVTQHAETGLVALATPKFSPEILSRSILYTSTEPCIMCCGAIYWAGIPKMVFGTTASQMSKLLDRDYVALPAREVFQQIHPQMVVVGPVMEEEGLKVHSDSK